METREVLATEICICAHALCWHENGVCIKCDSGKSEHYFVRTLFSPEKGIFQEVLDENNLPTESKVKNGR